MRRPPSFPTRFRAHIEGREARLLALPPDESDPATDYLWVVTIEGDARGLEGHGFTSHQAVHDLIERAEAAGVAIAEVILLHE